MIKPRSNHAELPATSVMACATPPPVQDSAVASIRPCDFSATVRLVRRQYVHLLTLKNNLAWINAEGVYPPFQQSRL